MILFFYDIRVLDVVCFLFPVCASEHFEFKHDEKMTTKNENSKNLFKKSNVYNVCQHLILHQTIR